MFSKGRIGKVVLYLVATVLICYGIGTAILLSSGEGSFTLSNNLNNLEVNQAEQRSIEGVKEINISVSSARVKVIAEKRDDVKVHFTGKISTTSTAVDPTLEASLEGEKLNISARLGRNTFFFGSLNSNLQLNVYIPENYAQELKVTSSSGGVNISDLKLSKLTCTISSGRGELNNLEVDEFKYKVSSGGIKASRLITKTSDITSSSGTIELSEFTGDIKVRSSSGSVTVGYSKFDNNVDISASSGRINLTLPSHSNFELDARTSSGRVTCTLPISINNSQKSSSLQGTVGSGGNKVLIRASSGSININ
jgi:lia operon protein LiaG